MKYLEFDLGKIRNCLRKDFQDPFCNGELQEFLCGNSKFIRSKLALLYFKAQNFTLNDDIYKILAIGEIIHNSSLLHDDVLDNADTRRGKETFSKIFNEKISILAGDYLLTFAIDKLLKINNKDIFEIFNNTTRIMCKSEIQQYLNRGILPNEKDYIKICKGKTAELFSAILKACAIILQTNTQKAHYFGELFGIYFQIKNDLEPLSSLVDKRNQIYTANDILGIEKTNHLLDNYKEEICNILSSFPDNIYKKGLEDLINNL